MATAETECLDDRKFKNYIILSYLGQGYSGTVWKALHRLTKHVVAIKSVQMSALRAYQLALLRYEIAAMKVISHPNIVMLYEVIEDEQEVHIVMEHCADCNLLHFLDKGGRLQEAEAMKIFRQLLEAVVYIHKSGFVHRDIKPDNVMYDGEGTVKLIDFGFCIKPSALPDDSIPAKSGSPVYMPPESVGKNEYDLYKADAWSLGATLFEMLTTQLPFDGASIQEVRRAIVEEELVIPDYVSDDCSRIIQALLVKDPDNRTSCKELHQKLKKHTPTRKLSWKFKRSRQLSKRCVEKMAEYYAKSEPEMAELISAWEYNDISATYLILQDQKAKKEKERLNCINCVIL